MNYIYAPWRSGYINDKNREENGCTFCDISKNPNEDAKNHVLFRDTKCFIVMNKFPYTPGHFMIIPHTHTASISALCEEEWLHITKLSRICTEILYEFGARGVNIGMNLGLDGGAGIPEHVHMHLVPRWIGDTNFITTIADTRVYGVDFEEIYQKLKTITSEKLGNIQ